MQVSVVIPTYNAARFIGQTLDAVLAQSEPADEVIVLDDGSTDDTVAVLRRYGHAIRLLRQANQGVAAARNRLCALAGGELIAFLDHDDVWHPHYLAVQRRNAGLYPQAAACFTGHVDVAGLAPPDWVGQAGGSSASRQAGDVGKAGRAGDAGAPGAPGSPAAAGVPPRLIAAGQFLSTYARHTASFSSMSFCCVPRRVLAGLGAEPFPASLSGADDYHFCMLLALLGPVVHDARALVAYRHTLGAQSADQLRSCRLAVQACERLRGRYHREAGRRLRRDFDAAHASKLRHLAKVRFGLGHQREGRNDLLRSLRLCGEPGSRLKSSALLLASLLPGAWQPGWLPAWRAGPPA